MKNKKGFTLIEVLIVSFLMGIIGLGVSQVIANSNKILTKNALQSSFISNTYLVMNDIARDIKSGYKISGYGTAGSPSASITITKKPIGGGADEIVTWSTDVAEDGSLVPIRTSSSGQKFYKIMGENVPESYKMMTIGFVLPNNAIVKTGKYWGVDVIVESAYTYHDSWTSKLQNTYYCRFDETGYPAP